jgi:hypothetical protein
MLSIEDIIKGFKFVNDEWFLYPEDGINYVPNSEENSVYATYWKDGVITGGMAHYELFLQKVIEGINDCTDHRIKQEGNILDVYLYKDGKVRSIKQIGGDSDDEAKENVIRYILEETNR